MKKNILLVEYSSSSIEAIQRILHDDIFKITVAGSEEEAKEILVHSRFDLVITESLLPRSHGFILSKFVSDNYPAARVIIISDRLKQAEYKQEAITKHGAVDFFEKPLPERFFRKRVLDILGIDSEKMVEMAFSSDAATNRHILPTQDELAVYMGKTGKNTPAAAEPPKEDGTIPVFRIELD